MADAYTIQYGPAAQEDLKGLRALDRKTVMNAIDTHLRHEPEKTSRSRIKAMQQPFWSQYRLRVDEYRVYYDVQTDANAVLVLRVLHKGTGQTLKEGPDDEED
jgi:mRNA interferase RelE/StbE